MTVCPAIPAGMMCPMSQLRSEEAWVKACIEQELPHVQVDQHDDGSQPSMYDLRITYTDGVVAAVEITAAMDEQQIRVRKSTQGRTTRWQEPNLAGGWDVRVSAPGVPKDFNKQLPDLLRGLEQAGLIAVRGDKSSSDQPTVLAGTLGVIEARQWQTAHPGSIYVMPERPFDPSAGYVPSTGDELANWLGPWVAAPKRSDNLGKLANSGASERHLFILVPGFSLAPDSVIDLLIEPGAPLPQVAPTLPPEVTHIWAMSTWDSGDGFRWSTDEGWTRFTKVVWA
jgi:hypothetical protein